MKKLSIIATAILFMVQVALQAQVGSNGNIKNMPHRSGQNNLREGCGTPGGIFIDEVTTTSATIHWKTNGALQYKIVYVNMDNNQEKGTLITPLGSVALDNLTPCSSYHIVIVAKCGDGTFRSAPQMFTTLGCN